MRFAVVVVLVAACGGDDVAMQDSGFGSMPGMGASSGEGSTAWVGSEAGGAASSGGGGGTGAVTEAWMGSEGAGETGGTSGAVESTGEEDPLAECPRLRVVVPQGEVLNVRPSPSTAMEPIGELGNGAIVDAVEAVQGEVIEGNGLWYGMSSPNIDGYVFSGFVECTFDEPPPPPEGFYLPFECGKQVTVTQGNNGDVSHKGVDAWAFDFGVGLNTSLRATADGVVQHTYDQTKPGDPCYDGGGPECGPYGNLVVVLHGDDTASYYKHLNEVHVVPGQVVARGEHLGLSGTTGYSTGPHLHIARQGNCGSPKCQSIPSEFIECGAPINGQVVVSMNCP